VPARHTSSALFYGAREPAQPYSYTIGPRGRGREGRALCARAGGRDPLLSTLRLAATAANCGSAASKGEVTIARRFALRNTDICVSARKRSVLCAGWARPVTQRSLSSLTAAVCAQSSHEAARCTRGRMVCAAEVHLLPWGVLACAALSQPRTARGWAPSAGVGTPVSARVQTLAEQTDTLHVSHSLAGSVCSRTAQRLHLCKLTPGYTATPEPEQARRHQARGQLP
jgi:hypothetical protein